MWQTILQKLTPYYPAEEARELTFWLLEEVTGKSKAQLLAGAQLTEYESIIGNFVQRLQRYEPIQYILGKTYWHGLELRVNADVLIPRPETAELVDWVAQNASHTLRVLDICTGSGCIAIALKQAHPDWQIEALDICNRALAVARENAQRHHTHIHFFQADILIQRIDSQYDILVCNPPYIMQKEKEYMHENILLYEPHEALFVPDNDPLLFYRAVAEQHLAPTLFFEIDHLQGQAVCNLLQSIGYKTELRQDINRNDRMVKATRNQ